jgi:hemerythrin-like domain-containing protein
MKPTETLKHEHQVILLVLSAAEEEAGRIQQTGRLRPDRLQKMVDFFRNFADRCHHRKEEDLLFRDMRRRGMSGQTGPIAVMLTEHDEGRRRVALIGENLPAARAGEASAVEAVMSNLRAYAELLRRHIEKEDNILYPLADSILTEEDQRDLQEAFEKVEREEMGAGVHETYHRLAHELAEG